MRSIMCRAAMLSFAVLFSTFAATDSAPQPDAWERMKYFVGAWEGTAKGQAGEGTVLREYQYILKDKVLHGKNRSTYPPQPKNPKGEVHENWDMYTYDGTRKRVVLRQFHQEGFVNQYVHDPALGTDKKLVFVTEAIENIPPGWRAKETYTFINNDEFVETFELAAPGKDFEVYSENHFTRRGARNSGHLAPQGQQPSRK